MVLIIPNTMSGSTVAGLLVALCVGSAVHCMPQETHRSRRQSQDHYPTSVNQGKNSFFDFLTVLLADLCSHMTQGHH